MSRAIDTTNGSRAAERRRYALPAASLTLSLFPDRVSNHDAAPPCAALFVAAMQRDGFGHVRTTEVPRARPALDVLGSVELSWRGDEYHDAVVALDEGVAMVSTHHGACEIVVAASAAEIADRHVDALARLLRDEPPPEEVVAVSFWSADDHYPRRRRVEAPRFADIEHNYPAATRADVARLVAAREPGPGALLLWHGAPGTGKTHALRALARAWRDWAAVHYVTDAERFLCRPGYLMKVATDDDEDDEPRGARLIVLEDAGELMAVGARTELGQGLSRVLNLADGLLGQGIRAVLLITTNEPVGRLHPAVRRPGRCWAEIDFPAFGPDEATAWLSRRGIERDLRAPATLAELYAIAEGRELASPPAAAFGFARATATAMPPASSTSDAITK